MRRLRKSKLWGGRRRGAGRPRATAQQLRAHGARSAKIRARANPPAGSQAIANPRLPKLLEAIRRERTTFPKRTVSSSTVCLDAKGRTYTWHRNDAAAVARHYAQDVIAGTIIAGRRVKKAAERFLVDLEHGHERGLFFDPFAARCACHFISDFCALTLMPWQTFIVAQLFGWKRATGLRRFAELWLSVGRKNGKTFLLAAIGLFMLTADQEDRAEIYSAACTRDQAGIAFRAARFMVRRNRELANHVRSLHRSLVVDDDSFFQPLSSDARTLDGLDIACALVDEVHVHPSRDLSDRLAGGTAARRQPLVCNATTAGESRECFAFEKNEFFERILEGVIEDDSHLVFIAELGPDDDYKDAANWPKANPSLGVLLKADFLAKELAECEDQPTKLNAFLRFHCNRWVEKIAGHSIPYDRIEACGIQTNEGVLELRRQFLSNFWHKDYWAGYDHGETDDLSALAQVFPGVIFPGCDVERLVINPHFWMPEAHVRLREKQWNVPLQAWIRAGFVKLLPGDLNDITLIGADILKIFEENRPQDIGFDRYGGLRQLMAGLIDRGFRCTEVPQTALHLTEASKLLKTAALKGELCTLNNPVLKWMLANVELEVDERTGLMKPYKAGGDPRRKIDGVQAGVNGIARWLDAPAPPKMPRIWSFDDEGGPLIEHTHRVETEQRSEANE